MQRCSAERAAWAPPLSSLTISVAPGRSSLPQHYPLDPGQVTAGLDRAEARRARAGRAPPRLPLPHLQRQRADLHPAGSGRGSRRGRRGRRAAPRAAPTRSPPAAARPSRARRRRAGWRGSVRSPLPAAATRPRSGPARSSPSRARVRRARPRAPPARCRWPSISQSGSSSATARAIAPEPVPTSSTCRRPPLQRQLDQQLGLRARDQHPAVDLQLDPPEAAAADDVGDRLAPQPPPHHLPEQPRRGRLQRGVAVGDQRRPVPARRRRQHHFGVEPGVLDSHRRQASAAEFSASRSPCVAIIRPRPSPAAAASPRPRGRR